MRLRSRTAAAAVMCLLLTLSSSALARPDVNWSGPPGGAWSLADNWDPKQVPHNQGTITYTATVNADGPLVNGGFTVRGLTVNEQVLLNEGSNLGFGPGVPVGNMFLNGNGSLNIAPGGSFAPTSLVVQGGATLTLSGNGSILMGGTGRARVLGGPTSTFDNTSWRIIGEGNLCEGFMRLDNDGTITASGGSLVLAAAGYTNTGLMSALTGSTLRINGSFGTMTNNGTILADGGIVQLAQALHIDGGTLATDNGGAIVTATGGISTMRLRNVANRGRLIASAGTNADFEGLTRNTGSITVEGNMRISGTASLVGGGTILMQPLSAIQSSGGAGTLLNFDNTIRGSGEIGFGNLRIVNDLDGRIVVDNNGSLTISPGAAGMRNNGDITVGNTATGGTLVFSGNSGGTFDNQGGIIELQGDASRLVLINGAVIAGGQILGDGTISIPGGQIAALNGGLVSVTTDVQGILRVAENIDGSGRFRVLTGANVHIDATTVFGFGHNWQMKQGSTLRATPGGRGGPEGLGPELINNSVIEGAGSLGLNSLKITNNGTIRANEGTAQAPLLLTVDPSPEGLLNAGVMEADGSGVMLLSGAGGGSFTQQGTALIRALGPNSNVRLGGTTSFNLSGGMLGAGAGSIAVDGGTTATIADLTSDALLTTGLGIGTIVINQNVINNGTVSLPGAGRLLVAGASTLNSASGHIASNGSITVANNGNLDANFIAGAGSVVVQTGGTLRTHAIRQGRLTISDGGFTHLKSAFTGSVDPSRVGSLTIGASPAFLDVTNRVLVIDQSGTIALNTLRNQIIAGYNNGAWDGPGIRSSVAAANPGHGVGYGEASAIFSTFPASYFGETIDNTTLLLTYTLYGDANLDRVVNLQDFNRLAANFGQPNKLWTDGEFTYDGTVNLADFNRLAANFGMSAAGPEVTPQDWAALAAAVPEPASVAICCVALAWMLARRRRATWCAALAALLLLSQPLLAQSNLTYIGPPGDAWHNAANWMPHIIPNNDLAAMPPVFYTVDIDRHVVVDGFQFGIAGMTNGAHVETKTSWAFQAGVGSGAPFLHNTGTLSLLPAMLGNNVVLGVQTGQLLEVTGGGLIRLGGAGSARILGGGTLINHDNTIRGEGSIGEGGMAIINHGVIAATADDLGGAGTLLLSPGFGGLLNGNTLQARNLGNLLLDGEITNLKGGTIVADDGGTVHMSLSPHIIGGTITTGANGTILVANQGALWQDNINLSGRMIVNSQLVLFNCSLTNNGSITVAGQLSPSSQAHLVGNGTIFMNGGTIDVLSAGQTLLTNHNYIRGRGSVGVSSLELDNHGVIHADGGALNVTAFRVNNFGTIVANGGTLALRGGVYINGLGTIRADDSIVELRSTTIRSGTLTSSGTGLFSIPLGETATLQDIFVVNAVVADSGGLNVAGQIGGGLAQIRLIGTRMDVQGTVAFGQFVRTIMNPGSSIAPGAGSFTEGGGPGGAVVFTNNGTISGAGSIGLNGLQLTNTGTIRGEGGTLTLDPSAEGMTNSGVIEATGAAQVVLTGNGGGSFTQSGGGVIRAADASSSVQLFNNAQLTGGQLGAGAGSISVAFGTITLQDLTNNANLVLLGVSTLMTSGSVVNNGTITTPAVGRLIVNGSLSLGGGGAGHFASNGSLTVNSGAQLDANIIQGTGTTTVQTGGSLRAHAIRQNRLTINDGATVQLNHATLGSADPSRLGTMTIGAAPASLDLTNRVLILDQSGAGPLNTLRAQIVSGYNGGAWNGPGINSTEAATNPGHGVGYGEASAIFSTFPATYFSQTIDNTTLLVTYTKYGDANLDRVVNLDDFNRLAANFGQSNRLWTHGDSTYDGLVNLDDFNRLAANFGLSAAGREVMPQDWAALASAVPEPAGLGAVAGATAMLVRRRSRSLPPR